MWKGNCGHFLRSGFLIRGEVFIGKGSTNAHFGDMDSNGDDLVSWDEFKAYFPKAEPSVFESIDLNADNALDHDEWHKFKAAHGLKHQD